MSVRMRHTRSHTRNRRSHHALVGVKVVKDKETGNLRLPHRVDEVTGMYRGRQIAPPKAERKAPKGASEKKQGRAEGHTHLPAEEKKGGEKGASGIFGRLTGERAKARSGTGS